MAITVETKNSQLHIRNGEKLLLIHPESIGSQIKLAARNGVAQADVQAELEALHAKIDGLLSSADAMQFKGVVNADTDLPTTYEPGWTWKVASPGLYKGNTCEVGDMLIAVVARDGSGNEHADFAVIQTNIDGAVTGPDSATGDNLAVFDGTTGKVIKDAALPLADVQNAVDESKKLWVKTVASLPDTLPEDLKDGGLLIVDPTLGS